MVSFLPILLFEVGAGRRIWVTRYQGHLRWRFHKFVSASLFYPRFALGATIATVVVHLAYERFLGCCVTLLITFFSDLDERVGCGPSHAPLLFL